MKIQVIQTKPIIFRIGNDEYQFVKPNLLYKNFTKHIEAKVKGSTLGWNIDGNFISYNQIRTFLVEAQKSRL